MKPTNLRYMVLAALFAALTAVGAYISLPIGPVPIVLSNLFVILAGLLLGKKWATASILLYVLLGALGLPVFSGATSGIAVILGPTGGFLFGFIIAAFVIALISSIGENALWKDIVAVICGTAVIYLIGVPWLKSNLSLDWPKALSAGLLPFIPGAILKGAAAVVLAKFLRPQLNDR